MPNSDNVWRRVSRRWRRPRFSLRALLIFMALTGIPIGVYVDRAERQRQAVTAIRDLGGVVRYQKNLAADWWPDEIRHNLNDGIRWTEDRIGGWCSEDYFRRVESVILPESADSSALPLLVHLRGVQMLRVSGPQHVDLSPVATARSLRHLEVLGTSVRSIAPLRRLTDLHELRLRNSLVTDVSPLSELRKITVLKLDGNPLQDISSLAGLEELRRLDISRTQVTDLSPLTGLAMLCDLRANITPVKDLSPLAFLRELNELQLRESEIGPGALSPLRDLQHLLQLELDGTRIRDADLAELGNLPLRKLTLANTRVTDSGLASLQMLPLKHVRLGSPNLTREGLAQLHFYTDIEWKDWRQP